MKHKDLLKWTETVSAPDVDLAGLGKGGFPQPRSLHRPMPDKVRSDEPRDSDQRPGNGIGGVVVPPVDGGERHRQVEPERGSSNVHEEDQDALFGSQEADSHETYLTENEPFSKCGHRLVLSSDAGILAAPVPAGSPRHIVRAASRGDKGTPACAP